MMASPDQRRSLSEWLACAAGDRGESPTGPRAEDSTVEDDASRCTASVVSGQRCRRPAAPGGDLCGSHEAMSGSTVATLRAAR
jgi:hypothetical protein